MALVMRLLELFHGETMRKLTLFPFKDSIKPQSSGLYKSMIILRKKCDIYKFINHVTYCYSHDRKYFFYAFLQMLCRLLLR